METMLRFASTLSSLLLLTCIGLTTSVIDDNKLAGGLKDVININSSGVDREELESAAEDFYETCERMGVSEPRSKIEMKTKELQACVLSQFNVTEIQQEMADFSKRGALDEVFVKYCNKVPAVLNCTNPLLSIVEKCLTLEERDTVNISRQAIDAAVDYICHSDGERIAIFIGEDGESCFNKTRDQVRTCVETTVPEVSSGSLNKNLFSRSFDESNCRRLAEMRRCIVTSLETCDNPTPSNVIDGLVGAMIEATPCKQYSTDDGDRQMSSRLVVLSVATIVPLLVHASF